MADERTIRVVLELEGSAFDTPAPSGVDGKGSASDVGSASGGDDDVAKKISKPKADKEMARFKSAVMHSMEAITVSAVTDVIDSYYTLEENYKAKTDIRNVKTLVTSAGSIFKSVAIGGAIFGVEGAAIMGSLAVFNQIKQMGGAYMSEAERLAELAYNKRFKGDALGLIDGSRGTQD